MTKGSINNMAVIRMKRLIRFIVIVSSFSGIIAFLTEVIDSRRDNSSKEIYERFLKRSFDAYLSTGAALVLSPVILIIALLVRVKLGSPVFFIQKRPGKDGKIFKLYKFRTMLDIRDRKGELLPDEKRLTCFGKKLRETSLDELPELVNIIKGDMAIVGPRPLLVSYLDRYNEFQARRHEVRPGITGLAQIHGRNSISWDEKFNWDVEYVDNITFLGDAIIIAKTLETVVRREGINTKEGAAMPEFLGN